MFPFLKTSLVRLVKLQIKQFCEDVHALYEKDLGATKNSLERQLMNERRKKSGVFKGLNSKHQVEDLNIDQLFKLHGDLFLDWMHFHTRCFVPLQRKVTGPKRNVGRHTKLVQQISSDLAKGIGLKSRISRQISNRARRSKLISDPLLWHWGIHHLHLGEFSTQNSRCDRTDELLFVYADENDVVVLGVGSHEDFAAIWLLEELFELCPVVANKFEIKGIIPPDGSRSEPIDRLPRSYNSPIYIDCRAYMGMGLGVAASGHSTRLVLQHNKLLNKIEGFSQQFPVGSVEFCILKLKFDGVCVFLEKNDKPIWQSRPLV